MKRKGNISNILLKNRFAASSLARSLCLCFLFVFVFFVIMLYNSYIAHSQVGRIQSNSSNIKTRFYACEIFDLITHCDPSSNRLESYAIGNISSSIYAVTGVPSFVDGVQGKALQMHANRFESVEVTNTPTINSTHFSVSFWMKRIPLYTIFAASERYANIISHNNNIRTSGWLFDLSTNTDDTHRSRSSVKFNVFNDAGKFFESTAAALSSNQTFVHICGTFDGSTLKIYKDGILLGKTNFEGNYIADPKVPLRIGGAASCTTCNLWSGIIDDLRLYNKTLDENQVKDVFLNSSSLTKLSTLNNLIGHWTFDGSLSDTSGNNNHGTLYTLIASMVFSPDGRLFFTEKNSGNIRLMIGDKVIQKPFVKIADIYVNWEQGLLGLAVDPDFIHNHFVYVYYTSTDSDTGEPFNRVVRLTDDNNIGTNMVVILDRIPASKGFHSGGALAFGPDGKLYITVGDSTQSALAQDPNVMLGKVLRINKDGTIPTDNPYLTAMPSLIPFPGLIDYFNSLACYLFSCHTPVYTIGHRNMYGIAFNKDGIGLVTENGESLYDEVNLLEKSGNYGYPTLQPPNINPELSTQLSDHPLSIKPLRSYQRVIAPTQMIYYDGDKIPQLKGKFLFGTVNGNIFALTLDKLTHRVIMEEEIHLNHKPFAPVVSIAQSPDGDIYYGGFKINKLKSIDITNKQQILFSVEAKSSDPVDIKNFQINPDKKGIAIEAHISNKTNFFHPFLTIKIPKQLFYGISKLYTIDTNNKNLGDKQEKIYERKQQFPKIHFTIDNSNLNYTTLDLDFLGPVGDRMISIVAR
jgi:glucose/arabinose dehydrogenase